MESKPKGLTLFLMTLLIFALFYIVNGFKVELIHPASSSNPLRSSSKTRFDWIREAYYHTQSRAAAINSRLDGGSDDSKFKTDMKYNGLLGYVMKYSVGSPPLVTYGIVDTASNLTWTQCQPCWNCFNQSFPIFNPNESTSYKTAPCSSDPCSLVGDYGSCWEDICQYTVSYGGNSSIAGDVATDTLTLGGSSFNNFVFGCGHKNIVPLNNGTSGIVGLDRSPVSLINQLKIDKFAYCISSEPTALSHISFGQEAVVKGPKVVSTPLLTRPDKPTFYWVSLVSISVGDKKASVIGGHQARGESGASPNTIIDSVSPVTFIRSDMFDFLLPALKEQIPATSIGDPKGMFDLCYNTNDNIKVPKIVLHFTGADVELSPRGAYIEVEEGRSCFTIVSGDEIGLVGDRSIFGILTGADYLIGYDLQANTVTFNPANCSNF